MHSIRTLTAVTAGATGTLAGVLLLTACGSERATPGGAGPTDDVAASGSSCAAPPPGDPSGLERDGVRITGFTPGADGCARFEITHEGTEPHTYTVTFTVLSASGTALDSVVRTVGSVAPGRTVEGPDPLEGTRSGMQEASGLSISQVRSVPADEAPSSAGPCPASGVRVYADEGSAAMGLRALSVHLENCGSGPYELHGYPEVQPLDEEHEPTDGVQVLHGGDAIASGTGAEGEPQPLVLAPGESARAGLVWRNTVRHGTAVHAPYARVRAKPGADWVTVVPELDLGTTGRLGVGPWKKNAEEDRTPPSGLPPTALPTFSGLPAHP
ncbi:DUF4232 domain-containing protein [Streptomyces chlorus]|uniref:DUF4232 domain-containing protein n=1 Tax=Streptomyces chlorus TaxID=887452 RepID=A0ABW1DUK7_9ACTN